ncbi:MAG: glycosyltransferase family 39 protein [Candidatus Levyibacteriota bacterium]
MNLNFFKKYRIEIILFIIASFLFFASRLFKLDSLPIFTDEAIYLRWSQIAKQDAAWRFISLTDGKQPFFIWLSMIFMRFIKDPLIAGRMVSVMAGFFSMIGLFFLGREIFKNRWVGIISSFLYVILPFSLVYDRMALYDSLVGTFAVWGLYFEILLIRKLRFDLALILGMILGGAVLTKTSGFFGIYLLPFSLLLFNFSKKDNLSKFLKWIVLAIIVVIFVYVYYSVLRLSPFFHIIDEKNAIFVYPFKDWLAHPFNYLWGNLVGLWDWFITYLTWPIFALIIISLFFYRSYFREKLLLLVWFLAPFFALALFGRTLYPRFIFFMVLSLLPLVALSIYHVSQLIKNRLIFVIFILLIGVFSLYSGFYILTDFSKAPIPNADRTQYFSGWSSGVGVKEAVAYFKDEAKKGPIYIATQGTFGLMPYSLEIYLDENTNVKITSFWPIPDNIPKEYLDASKKMPTYLVFYQPCYSCMGTGLAPAIWPLEEIIKINKVEPGIYFSVYKVTPR